MAHHLAWKDFPFAPQLYIFLRHLMAREVAPWGQGPPELGQGLVCCTDMKMQKGKVLPSRSKPCRKLQPLLSTHCTEFCCCPSEGSLLLSGDSLGPAAALPQTWQMEGWSCNPHLDDDVMVFLFFFFNCSRFGKTDWLLLFSPHVYFEILFSSQSTLVHLQSVSSDRCHQSWSLLWNRGRMELLICSVWHTVHFSPGLCLYLRSGRLPSSSFTENHLFY